MPELDRPLPPADLERALGALVEYMALVFDHDWDMTVSQLGARPDARVIAPRATFLNPLVEDESNNWANRGALLGAYRAAVAAIRARGIGVDPVVAASAPAGSGPAETTDASAAVPPVPTPTFLGRSLRPEQLRGLAMAWRPVGGVPLPALKGWAGGADFDDGPKPRTEREWRDLAAILDRWVRSPAGRAVGADERGAAVWEEHVAGFEVIDPDAARLRGEPEGKALRSASPRLAQSLSALADLHPWVAWMSTTNRAFPTDVVPRLYVRELGMYAHVHSHSPAWSWDLRLREAGVDPLGDPAEQTARALGVLRDGIARARVVGYGGEE